MLQQNRPASPHRGTHKEDRGQDSLAAELHSLISIVTVKFEWVWSSGFKLLKLVSGMKSKEIHWDWFGAKKKKKAWIKYLLCLERPQNLNFNVRLLSETWEPVKCSTCTSPNTVYVENGGKLFPSPRMPERDSLPLHFHFPMTNLQLYALSDFCWCALDKGSGTQVYCHVMSRPLLLICN